MTEPPIPTLVPPDEAIGEKLGLPPAFYKILKSPAPLAGCEFPFDFSGWDHLHDLGFHHVFCLSSENPRYCPSPLDITVACELDDLSWRELPTEPELEARQIQMIAERLAAALRDREGCLVHCAAGRGRTGTVMGVALRMLGVPADTIIPYLNALHMLRSGKGWPESSWASALVSRAHDRVY